MFRKIAFAFLVLGIHQLAVAESVLITGANSGIGLALATQYAENGWNVIATHRRDTTPDTLDALSGEHDKVRVERLDVTDGESISALAVRLDKTPIDILINNAGVISVGERSDQMFGTLDHGQFDTFMHTNVQGPIRVTEALYENVKAGGLKKIVMISSIVGSLEGATGRTRPGGYWYSTSKTALNMISAILTADARNDGIAVGILHPGRVNTNTQGAAAMAPQMGAGMAAMGGGAMGGGGQILLPPESAAALIERIDELSLESSGSFVSYNGDPIPW